jgi:hypothetical protein
MPLRSVNAVWLGVFALNGVGIAASVLRLLI